MRHFLRILGLFIMLLGVGVLALRGAVGISFLMGEKNFYPPAGQFLQPEKKSIKFAVLSDTGSQDWTLERLILEAKDTQQPDFVLHLGDLIVYRNVEHLYWMLDNLNEKLGDVPLYLIAGNHDVKKKKGVNKSIYQRVLGPLYYWFGYGNTLFIALDSSSEEIDDKQWAFFEQVMKFVRPHFKHVVLFTHVPPIVPPEYLNHHALKEQSTEYMRKMLKKYPVDLILSGHVHYYSEQNFEGIPIYTVPPSGQYFVGPVRKYGYLIVQIDEQGVRVENFYSNRGKGATLLKLLFVDLFLTDKVRWIAGSICLAGFLLWLLGHERRKRS